MYSILAAESAAGSMAGMIIWMVVLFAIMYFMMIRPQQKEQKKKDIMLSELAVGDTVLTTSGFYGTIIDITDDTVIVEENIDGFEVGCAVLGIDKLVVGRVDEIELSHGFFDFKEKYTLETSKIHMPARIDKQCELTIQETAKRIYRVLGCSGFARVDMFLKPDGQIVFNEVNTIPGFTSHSRYPNMLKGIGIDFSEVLERLISLYE